MNMNLSIPLNVWSEFNYDHTLTKQWQKEKLEKLKNKNNNSNMNQTLYEKLIKKTMLEKDNLCPVRTGMFAVFHEYLHYCKLLKPTYFLTQGNVVSHLHKPFYFRIYFFIIFSI